MPNCCTNCFNDKGLKAFISSRANFGRCGYCFSSEVPIIKPEELSSRIEFLLLVLKEDNEGVSAAELLNQKFTLINLNTENSQQLLSDIIQENLADKKYVCAYNDTSPETNWTEFKKELVSNNRYFPTHSIYLELFQKQDSPLYGMFFKVLEELMFEVQENEAFYRARLSDLPLPLHKMGAPPSELASAGRANPAGISYLYLAENADTSLAEVRPYNSCAATIATFNPVTPSKLLDLTAPRNCISPSRYDESEFGYLLTCIELLETFANELAKPIKPERAIVDYVPTQFLCEYIKSLGIFKGIVFTSSFGTGKNYVIFDPEDFYPIQVNHGNVTVHCTLHQQQ